MVSLTDSQHIFGSMSWSRSSTSEKWKLRTWTRWTSGQILEDELLQYCQPEWLATDIQRQIAQKIIEYFNQKSKLVPWLPSMLFESWFFYGYLTLQLSLVFICYCFGCKLWPQSIITHFRDCFPAFAHPHPHYEPHWTLEWLCFSIEIWPGNHLLHRWWI